MIHSRRPASWVFGTAVFFIFFVTSRHLDNLRPYYDGHRPTRYTKPWVQQATPGTQEAQQTHRQPSANSTVITQQDGASARLFRGNDCAWIPDTSNILVIMKTGASESFGKVPTQLLTTLKCIPDFLVFSDMKQTVTGVDIHDSLDTVLPEAMADNSDFDLYRNQQSCDVDQENCNRAAEGEPSSAGWNLDKYKNVHIAEKAYRMRPGYDWYFTIDADTQVAWPNVVEWLSRFDPSQPRYIGSVAQWKGFPFGHGGSGYVLSQAAMRRFIGEHLGVGNAYDFAVQETCCGDYMLAQAVKDVADVDVEQAVCFLSPSP
jgi:hypothetical protein